MKTGIRDKPLVALLVLLLLVRLAMVACYPVFTARLQEWAWSNNDGYETIAINWLADGVFAMERGVPTAVRLPLYPALIATCYGLAGRAVPILVMLVQAVLSTATGLLLYRMTERLFGRRAAIITIGLFILHPQANNFVFRCATETLFCFLVSGLLYATVRFLQTGERHVILLGGAALGLSLLVRETLAPLALLAMVLLAATAGIRPLRFSPRVTRDLVLAFTVAALITAPWIVRNAAHTGKLPVFQTWVGHPLFQGTHVSRHLARARRGETSITALDLEALEIIRRQTASRASDLPPAAGPIRRELADDDVARRMAYAEWRRDPRAFAGRFLRNLLLAPVQQMTRRSTLMLMVWNWPLLVLSLIGAGWSLLVCRTAFRYALPVIIVFGYLLAVHAAVWPQARYIMPGLLPFSAFAGFALARLMESATSRGHSDD